MAGHMTFSTFFKPPVLQPVKFIFFTPRAEKTPNTEVEVNPHCVNRVGYSLCACGYPQRAATGSKFLIHKERGIEFHISI